MGQAYSHWNSSERRQQQQQQATQPDRPSRPTSAPRAQSTAFRGPSSTDTQRAQRSRFSPYPTGSPRTTLRRSEPPPTEIAPEPRRTLAQDTVDLLAAAASAADSEDATENVSDGRQQQSRARIRAGNELLSRIVSRSVVNSIAQELDRRNRVLREERSAPGVQSELPSGVGEFQLDIGGGLDLYLNVLMFILAVLETELDPSTGGQEERVSETAADEPNIAGSTDATAGNTQRETDEGEPGAAGGTTGGINTPTSVLESINPGMQFRMFLLPGSIEQALDRYARQNDEGSAEVDANVDASSMHVDDGQSEQQQHNEQNEQPLPGSSAPNSSTSSENGFIEQVDEGIVDDDENEGSDLMSPLLLGQSNNASSSGTTAAAASSPEGPRNPQHAREQTSEEIRREEAQRLREEKFQRLRNIAQAMNDDRRTIAIPIVVLGLRINSELRRTTRMAFDEINNSAAASEQQQQQQQPLEPVDAENNSENIAAAQPIGGGLHGAFRGLRSRLGSFVPGLFNNNGGERNPGHSVVNVGENDDPGVEQASSANTTGGAESGTGSTQAAGSSESNNESNQPGLSVLITIRYMQLGNPAILPMVTYSMFPELFSSTPTTTSAHTNLSASNYDLFIEISNIIGQARATTVSQDIIDKRMKKYRFESLSSSSGGVATARMLDSDEMVNLVSAERCPVCLEEFALGDDLRVLACHHALHLSCGDAWFTQGSNMCPICRQPAIQIGSSKE
ncbi:hypothetical protein FB645_005877 [Coemansia sp. IMI 203386]|nr:hypothetical protein FB645_005877 [Coemansia sp. IMI 203386]